MADNDPYAEFGAPLQGAAATSSDPYAEFGSPLPTPAPQTGAIEAGLRGAGQGLSFGFSDEGEAAARAAYHRLWNGENKPFGDIYNEELGNVRARTQAAASQHPWAYYGGEAAGTIAVPGGLEKAGLESATAAAVRAGRPLADIVKAGAKEGAIYGGLYGTGTSEGGAENRIAGGVGGGLVGAGLGAAAEPIVSGATSIAENYITPHVNSVLHPAYEAARRIVNARDSDVAAGRAADAAYGAPATAQGQLGAQGLVAQGQAGGELRNIDNPDLGFQSGSTTALARSAANQSPEARDVLMRMVNDRYSGQAGRTSDFIRGLVTTPGNAADTRDALLTAARQANRGLYQSAYEAGDKPIWTPKLQQLSGSTAFKSAMKDAITSGNDRAIAEGFGAFNPGVNVDDSGIISFTKGQNGVPAYPNLQYWDSVKQSLDDMASSASRSGDNGKAGVFGKLASDLRTHLDTVVPEYQQARGTAATFFKANDAIDAGEKYATQNYANKAVQNAVNNMTPPELQAFQEGFVSRYLDKIDNMGDRQNIVGKLANSPQERQKLAIALGPDRAQQLEAFLHLENVMDAPRQAMGNSTTARQLVELGLAGGTGVLASHGNPFSDPAGFLTGALIAGGAAHGAGAVQQRMARTIAEMLVSRDPAVVQNALNQVAQNPGMMNGLRSFSSRVAAAVGRGRPALAGATGASAAAQIPPPPRGLSGGIGPRYDANGNLKAGQ